jgi:uncharacterized flavoprotein (TIGR03862 family)
MVITSPLPRIAVIGAGPAGLMAAERLAAHGLAVTVYDHMPSPARKLLMAGRGGLNVTHSESGARMMKRYGDAAAWLEPSILAFPPDALRDWCHGLGQETFVGSSGRVFPVGMKASPLLRAWLRRLNDSGVVFALRHRWHGWDESGNLVFSDDSQQHMKVHVDAVVLALGGASWPRLGSDGGWARLLRAQGVAVVPLRPANCGFKVAWSTLFSSRFAGQPVKPVALSFGDVTVQGEAMVTESGIEGSAVYSLSTALRNAIVEQGKAVLMCDLRPAMSIEEVMRRLNMPRGSQSMATYLRKTLALSPVALGLMRESLPGAALPNDIRALATLIKKSEITVTDTASIERAISTAGGVSREEIDAHFMLKKIPGVFVAGEMIDWEAPTGGYLLQASFSTAIAAAQGAIDYLAL